MALDDTTEGRGRRSDASAIQQAVHDRCAAECERLAAEEHAEMLRQPEGSPARDRHFARHEALRNAATQIRLLGRGATAG